ncbi:MAG: trypsin-like peptidase domain-containing protein [Candidatus Omnitrophica bacterium]|nr:trypsin-like peptidase domain-containing protein [Candidatus Omnitrophota bacterium]
MSDQDDSFCSKPLGPWIAGLVVTAVMLVFWVVMRREDIKNVMDAENGTPNTVKPPNPGDPKFPGPVQQAAFPQPAAVSRVTSNGGPQAYAQNNRNNANYAPAAITKATPNGGMQLVAGTDSKFQNSLKDAVNAIIPSVCDIHARRVVSVPAPVNTNNQDPRFAPNFDGTIDKFIENKGYENIGAGIFVDERGYILTNYHVTKDATDIFVTITGNPTRDVRADIVAQEPTLDLAVIKVRADGPFPEVKLGDSSFCQIGDYVVAVGSPFGMEQTVTSGIISGIRKSVAIQGVRYENLFQTDAPINHGSSGGPLVDLNGDVIGLNTAIYAPTGVFNGTGFAIPINDCKDFLTQALQRNFPVPVNRKGMVAAALPKVTAMDASIPVRFGLEVMPVNSVIAKQFGITPGQGVLVNRVMDESAASFAGIQRGDVVTAIAGVPVASGEDIKKIVAHFRTGDSVNVRILRNGKTDEILVKLQ